MSSNLASGARPSDWLELTKPRITLLVTLTTAAGFALATEGPFEWRRFAATLLGTALVAAGSATFNMVIERELDKNMRRTANRPLPAGRIAPAPARLYGAMLAVLGSALLLLEVNALTAAIGAGTFFAYVAVYTPMKTRSALATLVGAIPGATPPVISGARNAPRHTRSRWALVRFSPPVA